jgi:hypothetical protein
MNIRRTYCAFSLANAHLVRILAEQMTHTVRPLSHGPKEVAMLGHLLFWKSIGGDAKRRHPLLEHRVLLGYNQVEMDAFDRMRVRPSIAGWRPCRPEAR